MHSNWTGRNTIIFIIILSTLLIFISYSSAASVDEKSNYGNLINSHYNKAVKTPHPTSTPIAIPPPSNSKSTNIIVILGVFIVIVILASVLLNQRYRKQDEK